MKLWVGKPIENTAEAPVAETRLSDVLLSVRAMLRRRWLTLALVTAIIFAIAVAVILSMTPTYEATTRVRIDPSRNPLSSATTEQVDLGSEAIETEVSVLSSPELARNVVRKLNLQDDPEFRKGLKSDDGGALPGDQLLNRVTDNVLKRLSVDREKLTYIIAIKFKSESAAKAARIANAFAESYIDTRVGSSRGTATQQAEWFRQRLEAMGDELRKAEANVAQFRAKAGIVQGGNGSAGTITDQQIAPLSTQLATAESEAAEARSNLQAARAQIARGGLDAVSAVRSSPVISDLRRQRAEVMRSLGEVEGRYGERHPESIKVHQQLAALDEQIKAEANRAVGSLEADANAASARVDSLRNTLKGLESQQASNTRSAAIAAGLDREVATKQAAYDRMAQLSLESTQGARNSIGQAEIVDAATPPTAAARPHKPTLLGLALVVALALGFGTIIVLEMLASGMRSIADIETHFGVQVLAALPRVGRKRLFARRQISPAASLVSNPTSMYAESLRNLRTSLLGPKSSAAKPGVIAFTSALPNEGKTTTALSFARTLAMAGGKTLLIDCDLRRAFVRQTIGAQISTGLVEVLQGKTSADQAIIPDEVEQLDLLLVARPHFTAEDLFGGEAMSRLLASVRGAYDHIVLDLPPVLGIADTRTIAIQSDVVAFVVRWGSTPANAVDIALSSLLAVECAVKGAIYTMVDPSSEALSALYYSRKYSGYYTEA